MNREECEKALSDVCNLEGIECLVCRDNETDDITELDKSQEFVKGCDVLYNLIKEHFDNPPLNRNEIDSLGMPVYYLPTREWLLLNYDCGGKHMYFVDFEGNELIIAFEENCFYRREVSGREELE